MEKVKNFYRKYSSPFWIIALGAFLLGIYFFPSQSVQSLLNAQYFSTAITFFVGLSAYILYIKQKNDSKREAANIIFLEVQSATVSINQLKMLPKNNRGHIQIPYESEILKADSWNKYKHLFVDDFNPEQWSDMSNFYHLCKLVDKSIEFNNSYSERNYDEYRANIQKITSDYVKDYLSSGSAEPSLLEQKIDDFTTTYTKHAKPYYPMDPVLRVEDYLPLINSDLLLTSTGEKLRHLAGLKN